MVFIKTKKAGCILLDVNNYKIGLIYRKKLDDYSFPKGHLEANETLEQCAIRETEEETGQICHIIGKTNPLYYTTGLKEEVEVHFYFAIAEGKTTKNIPIEDQEELVWKSVEEVENALSYGDLKEFWNNIKEKIDNFFQRYIEFNKIKTPQQLFGFMEKNIKYGYVGSKTNKIYLYNDVNFNGAMFNENDWNLSTCESLLFNGYGQCLDQVEFEKQWFSNHNYEYKTIFIWFYFNHNNDFPTHTYLIYKENNKYYYFEHADYNNKGIYGFDGYKDAVEFQKNKHIEYTKTYLNVTDEDLKYLKIYEYMSIPGCNAVEFFDNIINNAKEIKEKDNF